MKNNSLRWRWKHNCSKKKTFLRVIVPVWSLKISNCDISALEHAYAPKIRLWASTFHKMTIKVFIFSKISKYLGIRSKSSQLMKLNLKLTFCWVENTWHRISVTDALIVPEHVLSSDMNCIFSIHVIWFSVIPHFEFNWVSFSIDKQSFLVRIMNTKPDGLFGCSISDCKIEKKVTYY